MLDPSASDISFNGIESAMFLSRRMLQPKIPRTSWKFCEILPTSRKFAEILKAIVMSENQIAVIFFSHKIYNIASDIRNIQFDWTFPTFQTVSEQFCQLWTIFFSIENHTFPIVHCLLTSKKEELYHAVLNKIPT